MIIYPAIDLYEGKVVRLTRGDFDQKKIYSDFPGDIARHWANDGASWIHIVDLEGAKTGVLKNLKSLKAIRDAVKCRLQFGGGMRSIEAIEQAFQAGADRVVLGTKALDADFFKTILKCFTSKIAVGIDIKDNQVQTQGWLKASSLSLEDALKLFNDHGVETLIYTDIQKDGMLEGPNFERLDFILAHSKAGIILSGGVGDLLDIEKCSRLTARNFDGAIVGKALYEKTMTLKDALQTAEGMRK